MFQTCLLVLSGLWVASEIGLALFRRAAPGTASRDAGTLELLNLVIYGAVAAAFVISSSGKGRLALPAALLWSGLGVIVAGLALKWWAVVSLRRFFTVDVAIHPGHQLVREGPYRYLRHPAYSGVLVSFAGLAVCTSSWISALVILVPIGAVFLHRIRVEERVLNEAFPGQYRAYAEQSWRLVPGLY